MIATELPARIRNQKLGVLAYSGPDGRAQSGLVGEQTVQYEREAEELKSPALERYQGIYFRTWPDGPARMSWPYRRSEFLAGATVSPSG